MRFKFPKINFTLLIIAVFLFVGFGDRVLPKPLSTASLQARTTVNGYLLGLFPKKRFKNPNERTETAVDDLERKTGQKD
ncbi:MAG TPA: hypothetical protein V6D12_11345 [Candidatus Obscuribacterales bacterium]